MLGSLRGAFGQKLGSTAGLAFDLLGNLGDPLGEHIGGGAAARLKRLGHGLGTADQQFLEAADAGVERAGNFLRAIAERGIDLGALGGKLFGERGAARIDGVGDLFDAAVERRNHFLAALGKVLGDFQNARAERIVQRLGAAVERFLETDQAQIERVGDFAGLAADALVEIVDAGAHGVGDGLGAVAEPLDQFGAMHLHGAVELAEMAGDEISERGGIVGDAFRQRCAALREHFLERYQPRAEHFLQRIAMGADGGGDGVGGVAEGIHHLVAARENGLGDGGAGLFHLGDDIAAAQAEIEQERIAGRLQGRIHVLAAQGDVLGGLRRDLQQPVGDFLSALAHQLGDGARTLREVVGDVGEPKLHHLHEVLRQAVEFLGDVLGLERHAGIQPLGGGVDGAGGGDAGLLDRGRGILADGLDRLRGFLRGLLQALCGFLRGALQRLDDFAAALAELRQHLVADAIERRADVVALLRQFAGDAFGRGRNLLGDLVADAGDVLVEIEMHAGDGVAHLFGLADQVVALRGEIVEQAADAHFVVVIGALQRRDFVLHQHFEFGGTRQRALDAVAHRRHFAADGLADGDDGFARDAFRLGQPQRHLAHRLRQRLHLARARDHVRDREEEADRRHEGDHQREQHRRKMLRQQRQERDHQDQREHDPHRRGDGGADVEGARGGRAGVLQDLADRFPVVIGGPAGLYVGFDFRNEGIIFRLCRSRLARFDGGGRRRGGCRRLAGFGSGLARLLRCGRGLGRRRLHLGIPDVQRFLDRRHGGIGCVLRLLRIIRHRRLTLTLQTDRGTGLFRYFAAPQTEYAQRQRRWYFSGPHPVTAFAAGAILSAWRTE